MDLLIYVARAPASRPLRLVVAYRDTEVRSQSPLGVLLADLARDGRAERMLLAPLARQDGEQLLDQLLPQADSDLRHRLLQRTGGLPYYCRL